MRRYLRITTSLLCVTACVLLIVLWVRSYWADTWVMGYLSSTRLFGVGSQAGQMTLVSVPEKVTAGTYAGWGIRVFPQRNHWLVPHMGFAFQLDRTELHAFVPHWFLVMVAGSFAALPWIRWRFSLRSTLIAMTLVSVLLGIIAISN